MILSYIRMMENLIKSSDELDEKQVQLHNEQVAAFESANEVSGANMAVHKLFYVLFSDHGTYL